MSPLFRLGLPGVEFTIRTARGIEVIENHPLYSGFLGGVQSEPPCFGVPVEVVIDKPRPDPAWPVVFDSGESWLAYRDHSDLVFAFRSATEADAFWWTARLNPADPKITVLCDPEVVDRTPALTRIANPIHYPLDQLLTMMLLADRGGCIVHAAGVHRSGSGIACIGRSGAGKTTLMGLLQTRGDLDRLSDDRLILRVGEPPLVSGTPWAGEGMVAANSTAELAALVFLHQGPTHKLQPISPREAAAQLLPTTSIPWFDEEAMTGCLDTLDRLVRHTPAYNLVFRRDDGVCHHIDQII